MSTSILMKKMQKYASDSGFDLSIEARGAGDYEDVVKNYEVILLGPQVSYQKDNIAHASGLPVGVIAPDDYAIANCEHIFKLASDLTGEKVPGKPAEKPSAAQADKPAEKPTTTPDAQPADAKPADARSADAKPADAKPDKKAHDPEPEKPSGGFFESGFMRKLQAGGQKVAANKGVSAIIAGMMSMMAIIMVGALFQIVATVGNMSGLATTDSSFYKVCMVPYNMTMGLISVYIAFTVAYYYGKSWDLKPVQCGIMSLAAFVTVAAPSTTYALASGSSLTALDTTALGSIGMFAAIIIALLSVRLSLFMNRHGMVIKMPDSVPQFLQDSFNAIIPMAINLIIWNGLNQLCLTFTTQTIPVIVNVVLGLPLASLTSVPGMIVIFLLATLLWCFGIHGTMVIGIALMSVLLQAVSGNADLVASGQAAVFTPVLLFGALATCGGTGDTLPLAVMCMRSKSEQLRAVGKASIIPGIFNINEPITFGVPIMYNPIMCIPYILTPIATLLLFYVGYMIGFFQPAYVPIVATMPLGVAEFLGSLAWQNIFMPVVSFVAGWFIFMPFFKAYEKQLVAKEAARKQVEAADEEVQAA
ncbi:MAG: PTS transporter subunit EIIC [Atopobiaceae bacterium]|jgi:PTS system cellobiose-specific IIC component|nr:PTS transporter subunit EIIC [Atopobiaceae bacterium]